MLPMRVSHSLSRMGDNDSAATNAVNAGRRSIVLGSLAAPLVGCARGERGKEVLRISWWGGSARHAATLKAIRAFEELNPSVRVKAEYMGFNGYLERLTTQIAGRSEPDLMQINWAWLAMLSKRGHGFADLSALLSQKFREQFSKDDLDSGSVAGLLNAVPISYSARILLWNKQGFDRFGVPVPTDWDSLTSAGAQFNRLSSGKSYPLDGELYDMMLLSHAWMQQRFGQSFIEKHADRSEIAISSAVATEWLKFYLSLVDTRVCTSLQLRASLGGAEKPTEQQPDWVAGNWAGNYTWDSVIGLRASTLPDAKQLVLGQFPVLSNAKQFGLFGRPALMFALSRNSKRVSSAAALLEFLLVHPTAAQLLGRTRGIPLASGPMEYLKANNQIPSLELAAYQQISDFRKQGQIPLPAPLFEHPRMHKFMREIFELVAYRKLSPQLAGERLVINGQALLKRIE